jgi:hypothetical protein
MKKWPPSSVLNQSGSSDITQSNERSDSTTAYASSSGGASRARGRRRNSSPSPCSSARPSSSRAETNGRLSQNCSRALASGSQR